MFVTEVMRVIMYRHVNGLEKMICQQSVYMKIFYVVNIDCNACNAFNPVTYDFCEKYICCLFFLLNTCARNAILFKILDKISAISDFGRN